MRMAAHDSAYTIQRLLPAVATCILYTSPYCSQNQRRFRKISRTRPLQLVVSRSSCRKGSEKCQAFALLAGR